MISFLFLNDISLKQRPKGVLYVILFPAIYSFLCVSLKVFKLLTKKIENKYKPPFGVFFAPFAESLHTVIRLAGRELLKRTMHY